jgi:hypothetical protein
MNPLLFNETLLHNTAHPVQVNRLFKPDQPLCPWHKLFKTGDVENATYLRCFATLLEMAHFAPSSGSPARYDPQDNSDLRFKYPWMEGSNVS